MADKPDDNTTVTPSAYDEFPGSLGERQYRSYRPAPSRHRGAALAVVGEDGQSLTAAAEATLEDLIYELRALRVAMMFAGTAADIGDGVEKLL